MPRAGPDDLKRIRLWMVSRLGGVPCWSWIHQPVGWYGKRAGGRWAFIHNGRRLGRRTSWTRDWRNAAELREAVQEWLRIYNEVRPHEALGWRTPSEKRAENLGIDLKTAV